MKRPSAGPTSLSYLFNSPVYEFLDIEQPKRGGQAGVEADREAVANPAADVAFSALLESAQQAREKEDFVTAKALFKKLYEMNESKLPDPYIVQQWALATYKSPQLDDAGN